jgi:signal transduction histidine kinase/chemotaxis methyl-accepting protein methylase
MLPDHGGLRVAVVAAGEAASVEELLRGLPDALRFALVLASPLSPEAVRSVCRVPVVAVDQRTPVEPGRIYVAPIDRDVRFVHGQLIPGEDRCAVARLDVLLRSVADELGARTTAVMLAGRGDGGVLGIQRVKQVGGWTLAQDASGEHDEMPRAAIATGRIDLVLPIDQLAARLVASAAAPGGDPPGADPDAEGVADALRDILAAIRAGSGLDLGVYRRAALMRRIARRMQICGSATIAAYRDHLRDRPGELAKLVDDLLIRTTQFFRDPATFDAIACDVMPGLFSGKRAGDPVRIWIAGCATGEEVYSLGILVLEHAARLRSAPQVQLFATDVDDRALARARQGCYPSAIALDVAPARLQRFFVRDGGRYRVHDELRELVLFACHDVLRDPPFSRLDLISCRSLMIDLEHAAQRRALARFHYALRGAGVLLLDRADAAGSAGQFAAVDREHGVFARLASTSALGGSPGRTGRSRSSAGAAASPARIDGGLHVGPVQPAVAASIDPEVCELVDELHRTRERLRITVEQYEASLEELKASNEELQAINDELRYATSELEVSKEELQSINEELMALNQELRCKVDEVGRANSDLQNLMTSTEIGVVFLDRGLRIQRFTPRAQDVFNIIPSDLGRPLAHLTHRLVGEPLGQEMWQVAHSVLDTQRPVERELRHRDGRCFLARWLPYRSIEDRIDGVVLTFVDVTDLRDAVAARRRSEQALHQVEERLQVALRSAPLAALGFERSETGGGDPDGSAGGAGGRAPRGIERESDPGALVASWGFLMGRELDAGERAGLPMLVPGHGDRLRAGVRQAIAERAGQRAELDLELDGTPRTFDFRIEPTASGATAVGFDITPSKLAETALRDADRRKDEFLATLSHELRNPLAPLQVALDAARLLDDDPRQRARSLSIMDRQITMLTTLVNELLDLSRISQGKMVLERAIVSLAHALESAVVATRPMFEAAHHELRIDVPDRPIEVDGDFRRLVQVFTNLLTNAAKYTPPSGHIDVVIIPGPASVAVRVQDDGLGITSDMLPRIFDIFVQSHDARERSQGGLGIGLNLVRRLVELHGGTVTVASAGAGHGSAFTVELPLHGGSPA